MSDSWDQRHASAHGAGSVARVLEDNLHLLPPSGLALDLACGRGANSLLLASRGLDVVAWDRSEVAIDYLNREAQARALTIDAEVRDVMLQPPGPGRFDLVLVAHFLERELASAIVDSLKPGGLLFYQTFTCNRFTGGGPSRDEWRLADGELLELFRDLKPRVYRDEGELGDTRRGWRDLAMLVAETPG